jgi:anaerobic selenocysteine-containing dehydrogenase
MHIYSEVLQTLPPRGAGQGPMANSRRKPEKRIETYFDPLPFYYDPLEATLSDKHQYPLNAVTQRPMAMYHSWDSQNAWLRQIHAHNYLHVNPKTAAAQGIADGDWIWVESQWGKVRCMARHVRSRRARHGVDLERHRQGGRRLEPGQARRQREQKGFLLNHLISEELPRNPCGEHISNSDPVTGQAAWYDVRVRIYKAGADEPKETWPQFTAVPAAPGTPERRPWQLCRGHVRREQEMTQLDFLEGSR